MHKPHITAVSLDPIHFGKETGIPFYLPKPLLIISKNFRNIEDAKTGLTDSAPIPVGFDDQAKYADLNARTNFQGLNGGASATQADPPAAPGASTAEKSGPHVFSESGAPVTPGNVPSDGLAPDTFFTYHIVFVPDLTQKYGLKIRGGPGEIRAAMNLVNGWQFTGLGPYYMKDSSTAQDILARGISLRLAGQAAADVLNGVADLAGSATQAGTFDAASPKVQKLAQSIGELPGHCRPLTMIDYAEIHVYEASLGPDGMMTWQPITELSFDRDFIGQRVSEAEYATPSSTTQAGTVDPETVRSAVGALFGVPPTAGAAGSRTESGEVGEVAIPGSVVQQQVQVDCDDDHCRPKTRHFNMFNFGGGHKRRTPTSANRVLRVGPTAPVNRGGNAQGDTGGLSSVGTQTGTVPAQRQTLQEPVLIEPKLYRPEVINGKKPAEEMPQGDPGESRATDEGPEIAPAPAS